MTVPRLAAPLRHEVARLLRHDISAGEPAPGARLVESDLCARYGVSRTVIREVLRQLESESLITLLPNRGPIVTVLSRRDIESIYEVRAGLEGLVGELFASRASVEQAGRLVTHLDIVEAAFRGHDIQARFGAKDTFYEILLEGTGNEVLATTLQGIHARIGIFRHYAFIDANRLRLSFEEMSCIVDAAAVRRDPEAARQACEDHIRRACELAIVEYQGRRPAMIDKPSRVPESVS